MLIIFIRNLEWIFSPLLLLPLWKVSRKKKEEFKEADLPKITENKTIRSSPGYFLKLGQIFQLPPNADMHDKN